MNKAELIASVAEKSGLSKKDSEMAVNAVFECIIESLKAGDKVSLVGFGTFDVKERAERMCKNPRTGESVLSPATRVAGFKAGKALKEAVCE